MWKAPTSLDALQPADSLVRFFLGFARGEPTRTATTRAGKKKGEETFFRRPLSLMSSITETKCIGDGKKGTAVWTAIHLSVRNDAADAPRQAKTSSFRDEQAAVASLISAIAARKDDEGIASDQALCSTLGEHLIAGRSLWCWEWRRRGNGDLFSLVKDASPDSITDFLLNSPCRGSVDVEDLLPDTPDTPDGPANDP
jgi:hypothetical protein